MKVRKDYVRQKKAAQIRPFFLSSRRHTESTDQVKLMRDIWCVSPDPVRILFAAVSAGQCPAADAALPNHRSVQGTLLPQSLRDCCAFSVRRPRYRRYYDTKEIDAMFFGHKPSCFLPGQVEIIGTCSSRERRACARYIARGIVEMS